MLLWKFEVDKMADSVTSDFLIGQSSSWLTGGGLVFVTANVMWALQLQLKSHLGCWLSNFMVSYFNEILQKIVHISNYGLRYIELLYFSILSLRWSVYLQADSLCVLWLFERQTLATIEFLPTLIFLQRKIERVTVINHDWKFKSVYRSRRNALTQASWGMFIFIPSHQHFI